VVTLKDLELKNKVGAVLLVCFLFDVSFLLRVKFSKLIVGIPRMRGSSESNWQPYSFLRVLVIISEMLMHPALPLLSRNFTRTFRFLNFGTSNKYAAPCLPLRQLNRIHSSSAL